MTMNNEKISEKQDEKSEMTKFKSKNSSILIKIQLVISILFLVIIFAIKVVNLKCFDSVKNWYFDNINKPIFGGNRMNNHKNTFNKKVSMIKLNNNPRIITTYCFNLQNNIEKIPITLPIPVLNPTEKGVVTSKFGKRNDPLNGKEKIHYGLDIGAEDGTPIFAIMPGIVEKAAKSPSFGNMIILDHGDSIKTLYAHCKELRVCENDQVIQGQNIALMGNTGYYSTGTHLHIEFIINGKRCDPEPFFENISV